MYEEKGGNLCAPGGSGVHDLGLLGELRMGNILHRLVFLKVWGLGFRIYDVGFRLTSQKLLYIGVLSAARIPPSTEGWELQVLMGPRFAGSA